MQKAVFEGLVFDLDDHPLSTTSIGEEVFYVMDDDGFLRHIPATHVDLQVWEAITHQIKGNEEALSEQAAKMMGQEDIFTIAVIRNQLQNKEKQFTDLQKVGIPEDARAYLGMMGFKVVVDHHGDLIELNQPSVPGNDDDN